jgi:hypothetical protein
LSCAIGHALFVAASAAAAVVVKSPISDTEDASQTYHFPRTIDLKNENSAAAAALRNEEAVATGFQAWESEVLLLCHSDLQGHMSNLRITAC